MCLLRGIFLKVGRGSNLLRISGGSRRGREEEGTSPSQPAGHPERLPGSPRPPVYAPFGIILIYIIIIIIIMKVC